MNRRVIELFPSDTSLQQVLTTKRVRRLPPAGEPTQNYGEMRRTFASGSGGPTVLKLHGRVDCFDRAPRKS